MKVIIICTIIAKVSMSTQVCDVKWIICEGSIIVITMLISINSNIHPHVLKMDQQTNINIHFVNFAGSRMYSFVI